MQTYRLQLYLNSKIYNNYYTVLFKERIRYFVECTLIQIIKIPYWQKYYILFETQTLSLSTKNLSLSFKVKPSFCHEPSAFIHIPQILLLFLSCCTYTRCLFALPPSSARCTPGDLFCRNIAIRRFLFPG
jgi:hypothetical protein